MKVIQLLHIDFPVKLEGQKVCLMHGSLSTKRCNSKFFLNKKCTSHLQSPYRYKGSCIVFHTCPNLFRFSGIFIYMSCYPLSPNPHSSPKHKHQHTIQGLNNHSGEKFFYFFLNNDLTINFSFPSFSLV